MPYSPPVEPVPMAVAGMAIAMIAPVVDGDQTLAHCETHM
jgi:hypothetical protein